ncbi:hypothetical protein [Frigidibacter sp. MR17.24]|uniref:hypothetical protein n=1 Tax=Frigidibacter sp. MR17.24 TaxID=3127345 RepID=UPI00301319DC
MPSSFEQAVSALPAPAAAVFRELDMHPDFDCAALRMQMTVRRRGEKVGGLNRRTGEWYLSKVYVANHDAAKLAERHGFALLLKRPDHFYWGRSGPDASDAFLSAVRDIARCRP